MGAGPYHDTVHRKKGSFIYAVGLGAGSGIGICPGLGKVAEEEK